MFGFILTFVLARVFVFLIMSKQMPNLYFFLSGTHVHHLNYGIFLLAAVCGYSVFPRPRSRAAEITALLYGVAMGLTFDEFGMWLHLGGSYWQRASVDAVIVVSAVFGLIAFARSLERFESRHFQAFSVLLVVLGWFRRGFVYGRKPPCAMSRDRRWNKLEAEFRLKNDKGQTPGPAFSYTQNT